MATIKSVAQQFGWECQKNYMYGTVGNYLFTARQVVDLLNTANNCKLVYVPLINITEEQAVKTLNYLKENKKELKVNSFEFSGHVLVIRVAEMLKGYNYESFNNLFNNLVEFFKSNDIATTPTCVYCSKDNVDSVMKIDSIAYHSHKECITKAQADLVQSKENFNNADKNYGRGMVGALLGALVGAIPWILLEIFWGYAAILSVVIGYASFYGYKKFGGLVTKTTKWLMLIAILFAVLVSSLVSTVIGFNMADVPFTLDNIVYNSDIILESLGLSVFFGLLGYISIFRLVAAEEFKRNIE